MDEVELLEANSQYAHVRLPDGRTVSLRHLAPVGDERQLESAPDSTPDSTKIPDLPLDDQIKPILVPDDATPPDQSPGATNLVTDNPPETVSLSEPITKPVKTPFIRTSGYNLRSGQK